MLKKAALALAAALTSAMPARAASGELSEYEVKAAFLVNFAKFTEWPAAAFGGTSTPLQVGIVGNDPFGAGLDDAVRGKLIGGRSMAVKRVDWRDDLTAFHIVFISSSEKRRLKDILRRLDASAVLTVSDIDTFISDSGLIAFVNQSNRIRFEVNAGATRPEDQLETPVPGNSRPLKEPPLCS